MYVNEKMRPVETIPGIGGGLYFFIYFLSFKDIICFIIIFSFIIHISPPCPHPLPYHPLWGVFKGE
jgi:hypothetical protein